MTEMQPFELHGGSLWTDPDTYLMTIAEFDKHLGPRPKKIQGISPESIVLRRLYHPEEFCKKPKPVAPTRLSN